MSGDYLRRKNRFSIFGYVAYTEGINHRMKADLDIARIFHSFLSKMTQTAIKNQLYHLKEPRNVLSVPRPKENAIVS